MNSRFSKRSAEGHNGDANNERKTEREEKREAKDIFLLVPLQEDAAVPFNGLNMQV